jgi:Protein of unknown function VcgC/VcgE (DUF2780)
MVPDRASTSGTAHAVLSGKIRRPIRFLGISEARARRANGLPEAPTDCRARAYARVWYERPLHAEEEATMTGHRVLPTLGIAVFALFVAAEISAQSTAERAKSAKEEASAAVKASPELVGSLSKEIGATPEQAAGAAGALFAVAKSRLKADEFSQIAKAVPGMNALLSAAPSAGGGSSAIGAMSKVAGTTGTTSSLATAASAFSKLGLSPDSVGKAVPVLTSFVTKSGGADVGRLLAGALK